MNLQTQHDPKNEAEITYWNSAGGRRWVDRTPTISGHRSGSDPTSNAGASAARQGERVVDIGCGAGASSIALAERAGPFGQVLVIDVSEPMLARAAERPRSRTAEQRDELAASHSITSSARASSVGGTSRPSAFAVLRLMTSRKRYQYRKEPPCAGGSRSRIRRFRRKAKARELLASLPLPRPQDVRRPAIATPSRVGPRKGA